MPVESYLTPYAQESRRGRPFRYLEFYREWNAGILAADGFASECEIDGDQAILTVRARQNILTAIGKAYPACDPEAVWTPTRAKPRNANGEVALDSGKRSPCKPLALHFSDVLSDADWSALKGQAEALMKRADREGYVRLDKIPHAEMSRLLAIVGGHGYGLDRISGGTFPTTGVLSSFTGVDENPISEGGNWTNAAYTAHGLQRIGNQLAGSTASAANDAYWNVSSYGPDSEIYTDIATADTGGADAFILIVRMQLADGDAYSIEFGTDGDVFQVRKFRVDNAVPTQLGSSLYPDYSAGASAGGEMVGSTLVPYLKTGGSWTALTSSSDATYSAAGYLNIYITGNVWRLDNFGGGTYVPPAGLPPQLALMGVGQ